MSDFRSIIKEVGRGARGARGLEPERAKESFVSLLNEEVDDIQLGAWWLAMRIKGETAEELTAFEQAMQQTLALRLTSEWPTVVLPCYNGARQLPNLVPLLAWTLAKRGVRVLLHGVRNDPTRVTTFELVDALRFPIARDAAEGNQALRAHGFVFTPIDAIHPRLARLLANRWRIGVRSTPHTIVKLLQPVDAPNVTRVVALTHGDYIDRLGAHLQVSHSSAVVFRGCEGEPVLHPKRKVELQIFQNGNTRIASWNGVETTDLPDTFDVATTVELIQGVMQGKRAMPPWIEWLAQELQRSAYETKATQR